MARSEGQAEVVERLGGVGNAVVVLGPALISGGREPEGMAVEDVDYAGIVDAPEVNEDYLQALRATGTLVVSLNKVTPPKFVNVSKELLQVCVNGALQPLFGNANYDYYWNYDNQGLRLAQMRFYPIVTTPIGGACTSVAVTPTP